MSSGGQVIRATQMFLKQGEGASKSMNLKAELIYGTTLGLAVGLTWKVRHRLLQWQCRIDCIHEAMSRSAEHSILLVGVSLEREEEAVRILHHISTAGTAESGRMMYISINSRSDYASHCSTAAAQTNQP